MLMSEEKKSGPAPACRARLGDLPPCRMQSGGTRADGLPLEGPTSLNAESRLHYVGYLRPHYRNP